MSLIPATMRELRTSRITKDDCFALSAAVAAERSTCARRAVGCILINDMGHVLATGYNGNAAGEPHCIDNHCGGACYPSGEGLDKCEAIHAEQNALLQCADVHLIDTAYVTTMPCMTCMKLLLNTSCKRIVYIEDYPHMEAADFWKRSGRIIHKYKGIL